MAAKKTAGTVSFPCSTFMQGDTELVLFAASGKKLWEICEINRRAENKDEGYQRALSPARRTKIAKFIDDNNLLPTCVVIAFDEGKLNPAKDTLKVPNKSDAGWVIDGQHRLAGASKAKTDITVPVVAMIGLDETEQINLFVTINKEQKGVPASLYLDLLSKLPAKLSPAELAKERAADLGQKMKIDEESPFYSRIRTTTSPKHGEISLTNFVRRVGPFVRQDSFLSVFRDEERQSILDNYYRGLATVFPKEYKRTDSIFFKTLGFGAIMSILPQLFNKTYTRTEGGFQVSDVAETWKIVEHYDFEEWHKRGTGTQAENQAAADLLQEFEDYSDTGGASVRL